MPVYPHIHMDRDGLLHESMAKLLIRRNTPCHLHEAFGLPTDVIGEHAATHWHGVKEEGLSVPKPSLRVWVSIGGCNFDVPINVLNRGWGSVLVIHGNICGLGFTTIGCQCSSAF